MSHPVLIIPSPVHSRSSTDTGPFPTTLNGHHHQDSQWAPLLPRLACFARIFSSRALRNRSFSAEVTSAGPARPGGPTRGVPGRAPGGAGMREAMLPAAGDGGRWGTGDPGRGPRLGETGRGGRLPAAGDAGRGGRRAYLVWGGSMNNPLSQPPSHPTTHTNTPHTCPAALPRFPHNSAALEPPAAAGGARAAPAGGGGRRPAAGEGGRAPGGGGARRCPGAGGGGRFTSMPGCMLSLRKAVLSCAVGGLGRMVALRIAVPGLLVLWGCLWCGCFMVCVVLNAFL